MQFPLAATVTEGSGRCCCLYPMAVLSVTSGFVLSVVSVFVWCVGVVFVCIFWLFSRLRVVGRGCGLTSRALVLECVVVMW